MRFLPFLHWGAPPNEINVEVLETRIRLRQKGKLLPKRLIRKMRVRRWFGISAPWGVKWFVGTILWDQIGDARVTFSDEDANP